MRGFLSGAAPILEDWRSYVGVSAGYVGGLCYSYMVVLFIAPFMAAYGIGETAVGAVWGASVIGIAAAPFLVSRGTGAADPGRMVPGGFALVVAGTALILLRHGLPTLLAGRLVAGFGEGLLLCAANTAGAGTKRPEWAFGIAQFSLLSTVVVLLILCERVIEAWGTDAGILLVLGVVTLCFLLLLRFPLPRPAATERPARRRDRLPFATVAIGLLLAYGLMLLADGMVFTFVGKLAQKIGLAPGRLSVVLSTADIIATAGSLAASLIGPRFGRVLPLSLALGWIALNNLGMTATGDRTLFVCLVCSESFCLQFAMPYFLGMLSWLDPSGGWTRFSGTAVSIAGAIAPILGGSVAEFLGYGTMGGIAVGLLVAAWLLVVGPWSLLGRPAQPERA